MENFEEELKKRTAVFKAKVAEAITKADKAIIHAEQTAQAFKEFAEEIRQEKLEKMKALKPETESV
jgi:pentose-5-phosphate-3-epimerase